MNVKKTINLTRPMTAVLTYAYLTLCSLLILPELVQHCITWKAGASWVIFLRESHRELTLVLPQIGGVVTAALPDWLLTLLGPAARSFSSLWTRSCRFALSCSKASTVPCSVLTEALSLRSTASCEEEKHCCSILEDLESANQVLKGAGTHFGTWPSPNEAKFSSVN